MGEPLGAEGGVLRMGPVPTVLYTQVDVCDRSGRRSTRLASATDPARRRPDDDERVDGVRASS